MTQATTAQEALNALLTDSMPPQGSWGDEPYLWLTDRTHRLIEFTDGYVEELPVPTVMHQAILSFLNDRFKAYLKPRGGFFLFAGLRVRIREGKFREPDLAALRHRWTPGTRTAFGWAQTLRWRSSARMTRTGISSRNALTTPRRAFPSIGSLIPRFETITVLTLGEGAYVEHGVFSRGATATSPLLEGFAADIAALFDFARG